jgi:hypothetical protein
MRAELRAAALETDHEGFFGLWHEAGADLKPEALLQSLNSYDRSGRGLKNTHEVLERMGLEPDEAIARPLWESFVELQGETLRSAIARRSMDAGLLERLNDVGHPEREADE